MSATTHMDFVSVKTAFISLGAAVIGTFIGVFNKENMDFIVQVFQILAYVFSIFVSIKALKNKFKPKKIR